MLDESLGAFTSEQVMRLTGITRRRLAYWVERGVLVPEIDQAKGRGRVRLFSFSNLVEVRVAMWLRDKVSLQLIRKIVGKLRREGHDHALAEVRVGVGYVGRRGPTVYVMPESGAWEEALSRQIVMEISVPLREFADELRSLATSDRAKRRKAGRIERRRGALGSLPVLAGTRVPTKSVWALHNAGYSPERIIENYPGLTVADVKAAIRDESRRRGGRRRSA